MQQTQVSDMAKLASTGLLVGAAGIVLQIVGGIDFPVVPPGLVILVVAAGLVAFARWRWVPFIAVVPLFPARRRHGRHRQRGRAQPD
jgi:hypothetical protein